MPIAPVSGNISHKFGEDRGTRSHNGVDYDVKGGTPVRASASGRVVRSTFHAPKEKIVRGKNGKPKKRFAGSYGNVIIIYHGQDLKTLRHIYTLYAHLDTRTAKKGDDVELGEEIGTSGRTGTRLEGSNSKGKYELHFEVIKSPPKLNWVKNGDLDLHFAREEKRKDPEKFFRSTFVVVFTDKLENELVAKLKGKELYRVDLGDGTTLAYYEGGIYIRRDSNGRILHVTTKGKRPPAFGGIDEETKELMLKISSTASDIITALYTLVNKINPTTILIINPDLFDPSKTFNKDARLAPKNRFSQPVDKKRV